MVQHPRGERAESPKRDSLHHEAFSELRVARSFFENYLPVELATACDWSTLSNETPVYKKCFDTDAFCDLLFAVRFRDKTRKARNQPLFLNLLFEHQSRPDPLMPFRLLRYMVSIWERYLVDNKHSRRLPPIYPIVLHQSRRQWKAPVHMRQLFEIPDAEGIVADWIPDFRFHLIDLAALPFDQLRENIIANGLLAIMKAIEEPNTALVLDPVLEVLNLALVPENDSELLSRFLNYLFHYSRNLDKPQFIMKIEAITQPAMKNKGLSLAEQFIAEGHEKGLIEGRQEGRKITLVATLERQLTRRFGELPENIRARLHNASIPELEALTDAILDAKSLGELFPQA